MHAFTRLGILTLVIALVLAAFTWPSGRLEPRDLPIGVVGPVPAALAHGDAFDVHRYASEADARAAIRDREVYGAIAGRTALVATGASPAVAAAIRQAAPQARVVDLAPGTRSDPRVATLSAVALPLTLIGIVAARGSLLVPGARSTTRACGAAWRMAAATAGLAPVATSAVRPAIAP